jgi:DNA-binding NtrC family response regulator
MGPRDVTIQGLPQPADYHSGGISAAADAASGMPQLSPRALTVLVVDDEPDVRDLLVEYFRERGCEVTAAAEGREAIGLIQRTPGRYTLVVTDLQLPGLDGLAVLRAARDANPSVYVVIITGYASLDSAIEAVRLGAYDYLTKPFSLGQIDVIVKRMADRLSLEAENRQLARQAGDRDPSDLRHAVGTRLDAIEGRLQRIEALLTQLSLAKSQR